MPDNRGRDELGGGGDFKGLSIPDKYSIPDFDEWCTFENLLQSWREFVRGKRKRADVAQFASRLIDNLMALSRNLKEGDYKHDGYWYFKVTDPKPRDIHKASVRDRVVHHALYRALYPYFDRRFIYDSYSCRVGKGQHRALRRFEEYIRKVGRNGTRQAWVLKGDIKKCFASVDHAILKNILDKHMSCLRTKAVTQSIIDSFRKGIPLGNLTSQLFINVYLNEFDQFVKRELKVKHYIRYADDFVILAHDRSELEKLFVLVCTFLGDRLKLCAHPNKCFIKTISSGVDFLGWVHFTNHRVLRTSTKRRMMRVVEAEATEASIASYLGLLKHGNARKLEMRIKSMYDL